MNTIHKIIADEVIPVLVAFAKARTATQAGKETGMSRQRITWTVIRCYPYREQLNPMLKENGLSNLEIVQLWETAERGRVDEKKDPKKEAYNEELMFLGTLVRDGKVKIDFPEQESLKINRTITIPNRGSTYKGRY